MPKKFYVMMGGLSSASFWFCWLNFGWVGIAGGGIACAWAYLVFWAFELWLQDANFMSGDAVRSSIEDLEFKLRCSAGKVKHRLVKLERAVRTEPLSCQSELEVLNSAAELQLRKEVDGEASCLVLWTFPRPLNKEEGAKVRAKLLKLRGSLEIDNLHGFRCSEIGSFYALWSVSEDNVRRMSPHAISVGDTEHLGASSFIWYQTRGDVDSWFMTNRDKQK